MLLDGVNVEHFVNGFSFEKKRFKFSLEIENVDQLQSKSKLVIVKHSSQTATKKKCTVAKNLTEIFFRFGTKR